MNIIKKYIIEKLEKIIEDCKGKFKSPDIGVIPCEVIAIGFKSLGYSLQLLLQDIMRTPFVGDSEKLPNYVGTWKRDAEQDEVPHD